MSSAKSSVLVSYIEKETNSICSQEMVAIAHFIENDYIDEIYSGHEIELPIYVIDDSFSFLSKHIDMRESFSSIRFRSVADGFEMNAMPSGSELFHMLFRGKGLSAFSMTVYDDEDFIFDGQFFKKFVDNGSLERREFIVKSDDIEVKYVLFYLPQQAWRAEIYESLRHHLARASWTSALDRIEALVLGRSYLTD
jgi:hypothetical protein